MPNINKTTKETKMNPPQTVKSHLVCRLNRVIERQTTVQIPAAISTSLLCKKGGKFEKKNIIIRLVE